MKTTFPSGDLILMDNIEYLTTLGSDIIDLTVTSPPYDDLRTYNSDAWTWDCFTKLSEQLFRITQQGGVVVWIVNDAVHSGSESGSSFRQALHFKELGFRLHDTMIWKKPNFSNPSSTRYHQTFEYMFVFSKGKPKTFNPLKDRPNIYAGKIGSQGRNTVTQADGSKKIRERKVNTEFGMRHNVWEANTSGQDREHVDHPATFPIGLIRDHITSWSNLHDLILDPFMGSGTTAIAAHQLDRKWIGIERYPHYYDGAVKRIGKFISRF